MGLFPHDVHGIRIVARRIHDLLEFERMLFSFDYRTSSVSRRPIHIAAYVIYWHNLRSSSSKWPLVLESFRLLPLGTGRRCLSDEMSVEWRSRGRKITTLCIVDANSACPRHVVHSVCEGELHETF
jgi:hypothetical protein